jgi:hypothetical protein
MGDDSILTLKRQLAGAILELPGACLLRWLVDGWESARRACATSDMDEWPGSRLSD